MNYIELVSALVEYAIPFDAYHVEGYHPHETICIPSRNYKCCEILYFNDQHKVEVTGFKCMKTYKKIDKENFNSIMEMILTTMNRCAL